MKKPGCSSIAFLLLALLIVLIAGQEGVPSRHGYITIYSPVANQSFAVGSTVSISFLRWVGVDTGALSLNITLISVVDPIYITPVANVRFNEPSFQCPASAINGGPCFNSTTNWTIPSSVIPGSYKLAFIEPTFLNSSEGNVVMWDIPIIITANASSTSPSPTGPTGPTATPVTSLSAATAIPTVLVTIFVAIFSFAIS